MAQEKGSRTAYKVALSIVTLGAKPGMDKILPCGIVSATEHLLLASGVVGSKVLKWSKSRRMVSVYEAFDWMLPGQFEAFAHRKAFCERQVREGIRDGAVQILVLGAGYDTLGWRLSQEFPAVNFFEIDEPPTAALKAKGIKSMGQPGNLFLIPEDLGKTNVEDVLGSQAAWDRNSKSVFLAEGLLMYLHPKSVRELFIRCARVVGKGSRFAFSYIPSGSDGRPDAGPWSGLMLWLQRVIGEPWIWSIQPGDLGLFLEESGWRNGSEQMETTLKQGVEYYAAAFR